MTATVFRDLQARHAIVAHLPRLLHAIEAGEPKRPTKRECLLFSPFTFGDKATERGALRSDANAMHACAVVGEHDAGRVTLQQARDALVAANIAGTLYTTPSHRADAPRWRVICPTAGDVPKANYPAMVARLNGVLGGELAPESFRVAQAFYFGRVDGVEFESANVDGDPIDVRADLDATARAAKGAEVPNEAAPKRDRQEGAALFETIRTGAQGVHDALVALAARYIARGVPVADVAGILYALMDGAEWRATPRWRERRAEVPAIVDSAVAKFSAWGEPVNLFARAAAPSLTADDVPAVIGDAACLNARASGFDPTSSIVAGVVTFAAALDDRIRLRLPIAAPWFESGRLWALVIGGPSCGKTPSQKRMLAPLFEAHRDRIAEWSAQVEAATEAGAKAPLRPALYSSDATVEKLSEILAANPRGLLYTVDEFESWIGSHDAYRSGGGSRDRGEWLRLYDGGPHQVDRIGRGSLYVENWGASVLSATTPAAVHKLAPRLPNDGLLQRFLAFTVRPMVARDASILRADVEAAFESYDRRARDLLSYGPDFGHVVHLSPEARAVFEGEEARLRALTTAAEAVAPSFAAHVGKHVGMLARVALIFHAAEVDGHPAGAPVAADSVRLAARFMDRAFRHAYALYGDTFADGTPLALARATARAIVAGGLAEFNRRDLAHCCRAFRGADGEQQASALRLLADYGWTMPDREAGFGFGARWRVNPRVHDLFRSEGEAARAQRDALVVKLREGSE